MSTLGSLDKYSTFGWSLASGQMIVGLTGDFAQRFSTEDGDIRLLDSTNSLLKGSSAKASMTFCFSMIRMLKIFGVKKCFK
jgi:hypothetical protein